MEGYRYSISHLFGDVIEEEYIHKSYIKKFIPIDFKQNTNKIIMYN